MKRMLLAFALVVIVPLSVFSQGNHTPTPLITPPPNNADTPGAVTGLITAMSAETITLKSEAANPMSFALGKKIQIVDKKGKKVKPNRLKAGARVRVYYEGSEDTRTATKIVLES